MWSNANDLTDKSVLQWLQGFLQEHGTDEALQLLRHVGDIPAASNALQ
jgi:hypothetical protein